MKRQIRRLAPHQNGKVAGILMAITSLPMFALTIIPMLLTMPKVDQAGNPIDFGFPFVIFLFMPVLYLVFTYLFVGFGCWVYNVFYKWIGGIEFEFSPEE